MRVLVTGANGFVGRHLCEALTGRGDDVVGAGGPESTSSLRIDLADPLTVRAAVDLADADTIVHLAAQAFVPDAIAAPQKTYDANITGTATVLQAVRDARGEGGKNPRIIVVSSAEVYGAHAASELPLTELAPLRPTNPYAASKAAAEAIALAEARTFGMDIVVTRAFNHIGPGQSEFFAVASFAAQLARVSRGDASHILVGNLQAQRDFLDVRDVARAYVALIEGGQTGEVYNICSGHPIAMSEVLRRLISVAHVAVEVREDPTRMRPSDVPYFYGDNAKLREHTGWEPRIALDTSLRDIYTAAVNTGSP